MQTLAAYFLMTRESRREAQTSWLVNVNLRSVKRLMPHSAVVLSLGCVRKRHPKDILSFSLMRDPCVSDRTSSGAVFERVRTINLGKFWALEYRERK